MEKFPISPTQFIWLWLGTMTLMVAAATIWRKAQRLPFFRPQFSDVEVQRTWTTGASSVGLMGSLARANNCLWFVLTKDALHVGAHFPFNLFMPRFIVGLDLSIPVATISSVTEKTAFSGNYVRVDYEVEDPARGVVRIEHLDLWSRRGDHFFNILQENVQLARQRRAV